MSDPTLPLPRAFFRPRPLENLIVADELESLDPIIDSKVLNFLPNSDTPQIFAACGRGARSTFRTLRHGLEVEESVSSDLPGIPNAVWTTKRTEDGACIVLFAMYQKLTLRRSLRLLHHPVFRQRYSGPLYRRNDRRSSRHVTLASSLPLQRSLSNKSAPTPFYRSIRKASDTSSPTVVLTNGAYCEARRSCVLRRISVRSSWH